MTILINDIEVTIPSTRADVTLGQMIAFDQEHGQLMRQMLASIATIDDPVEKYNETLAFQFERMTRAFSFFAGTTLEAAQDAQAIDMVAAIYVEHLKAIVEDEAVPETGNDFEFDGARWCLPAAELQHGDRMSFGEIVDSKQVLSDLAEKEASKLEQLLPVSTIFLRQHSGEYEDKYEESFLYPGSDRLKLMERLPMNVADQVGFFLTASMSLSIRISLFFRNLKQSLQGGMYNTISTVGVG